MMSKTHRQGKVAAAPDAPFEFTLHVSADTSVNAFAAPGGYVLITRGMYELADSDADAQDMQALGREVGRRSVERLGSGLTRLVEESSALYRWALTMLVLLTSVVLFVAFAYFAGFGVAIQILPSASATKDSLR